MFFRRERLHTSTFEERLQMAAGAGFKIEKESATRIRAVRNGCAAWVSDGQEGIRVERAGVLLRNEIARLVDIGFQKFWRAGTGKVPATAPQLHALHEFEDDLKEALGVTTLYNQALGTENDLHLYDRVQDRDAGVPKRAWER
jgi:hypothetical protein